MLERERELIAAAARELSANGLVLGTAGNVSARHGDLVAITRTGAELASVDGADVTVVGLPDGQHLHGAFPASSELALHLGIYRRFDAGAIVHTHAPVATALACVVDEVPVVHYQQLLLGGSIRVAPYATFGSDELAELTVAALDGRRAALMSGHGAIVFDGDLPGAVGGACLLEWICTVFWRARAIGSPRTLSEVQQAEARAALAASGEGVRVEIGESA
jgi:L-fuculose-phosphate aldolase